MTSTRKIVAGDGFRISSGGVMLLEKESAGQKLYGGKAFANPKPAEDTVYGKIAMWGSNNLLPNEMATDIENTGVLTAAIDAKARIAIGKGPMPAKVVGINKDGYEELEFISDPEIMDWLEATNSFKNSYDTMRDLFGLGNAFQQILLSADRSTVLGYKRQDPCRCRFERADDNGLIPNVHMSGDWQRYATSTDSKDPHFAMVPLLNRDFPAYDLQNRKNGNTFMLALQHSLTNKFYYAPSPWYAARKWVKIAQGIPEMKEAMFKNQMTIKYVVDVHPGFWNLRYKDFDKLSTEEQVKKKEEWLSDLDEYLVGSDNQYKSFISEKILDRSTNSYVPAVSITALDDKVKDGKLIIDSASANLEILLPLMMNGALLGVDLPGSGMGGGAGSGSDIREAYLVQVMMLELERKMNNTIFDIAKKINGWDKKYPGLVFRYPNQILTTLNTGNNTQPTS